MEVIITGKTNEANKKLLEWGRNPKNAKDGFLRTESPPVWVEEYKTSAIDFMITQTAKRLKIPKQLITKNDIHRRSVLNRLKRKASKKLGINKESLEVEVIDNE